MPRLKISGDRAPEAYEAIRMRSRIAIMKDGGTVQTGRPEDIVTKDSLLHGIQGEA